jgi:hypothetical protein
MLDCSSVCVREEAQAVSSPLPLSFYHILVLSHDSACSVCFFKGASLRRFYEGASRRASLTIPVFVLAGLFARYWNEGLTMLPK